MADQQTLDAAMSERGAWPADSPWIRDAMAVHPRHAYAPDRLWQWTGRQWAAVDRAADPDGWAAVLYAGPDQPAVTQLAAGLPASSMSCPAVVADMLDSLIVEPGHRVLELGTGTGWNAALLAHRAGPGSVVSVEVDAALAGAARARLDAAGAGVRVVVGDGAAGYPAGALYDRLVATYAVDRIPWAWVRQVQPGGRLVVPWGRLGHVALTVADDSRSARGWVQGLAQFMPARDQLAARGFGQVRGTASGTERPYGRDPGALRGDWALRFALRAMLPDVHLADGPGGSMLAHDGAASWAVLSPGRATQGGPRRLADAIDAAWAWWEQDGRPGVYEWGMTVTPGLQTVWCHDPDTGPRWVTPAGVAA